jgi:hypothetical protein
MRFSLHFSLGVEGWLWIGWVVDFGWFNCLLPFVVVRARNELRSILLVLFLISLKSNPQFVCRFGCILLNPTQILPDHFLAQNGSLWYHGKTYT